MDRVIWNILLWTVVIHITDNNPYPFMVLNALIMVGLIIFHLIESTDPCENMNKVLLIIILYIFTFLLILGYIIQSGSSIINTINILQNNLYSNNHYSSIVPIQFIDIGNNSLHHNNQWSQVHLNHH